MQDRSALLGAKLVARDLLPEDVSALGNEQVRREKLKVPVEKA
jgi:hypothetical protein